MSPRQVLRARIMKVDEDSDLALLKSTQSHRSSIYRLERVTTGMDVITMGYPQVSVLGTTQRSPVASSTASAVCATTETLSDLVEVQKGNSGGPLIGPGGMVVGVVDLNLTR